MKFTPFRLIALFSILLFISSCSDTDKTTITTDGTFVSLTFEDNDTVKSAVFTLVGDTIVNIDSLPYQTPVNSLYPILGFKSSSTTYLTSISNKDSVSISKAGAMDFSKPISIRNYASDKKTPKTYLIKVNVHTVEPKLYIWDKVSTNMDSHNATSQKAIILNDIIFYYQNDGSTTYLYTSTDGNSWSDPQTATGLPANTHLGDMTSFKNTLYLTQDNDIIYSSADGYNWTAKSIPDYSFKSLLFSLNDSIHAVTQSKTDSKYRFASSNDGITWIIRDKDSIPDNFPVRDFASVSFTYRNGKPKALLLGGYSKDDIQLKNRWSTENGTYWVDFSTENQTLETLAVGSSVIAYDDCLFVFGTDENNAKPFLKKSIDEGLSWQMTDSLNRLPNAYQARTYQSVVVFKPKTYGKENSASLLPEIKASNRIFIIGGKENSTVYSDVWTGKVNHKNFLRQ